MRTRFALVLALSACAPAPMLPPVAAIGVRATPAAVEPAPPAAPAPDLAPPAPQPVVAPAACRVAPLPVLAPPPPSPVCAKVPAARAAAVRAAMTKRYAPTAPKARLVVDFGCDPVGDPPAEIVYEYGSGHGQDLALVRLRRDGASFSALRVQLAGLGTAPPRTPAERGTLPAAAVDAVLPTVRALLLAGLSERVPPNPMEGYGFFSSGDFHARVRLQDAGGHSVERGFTGYPSSTEQLRSLPMIEVRERLYPLIDAITWQPAPVDDDVRAFFVERFVAAGLVPEPGRAEWWVKERLVLLAEHLGTPALVPALVQLARTGGGGGASADRTREYAVSTLATLTGFDARADAQGRARDTAAAAAEYARACGH